MSKDVPSGEGKSVVSPGDMRRMTPNQFLKYVRTDHAPPPPPPPVPEPSLGDPTPERLAKEPDGFSKTVVRPGTVYKAPEVRYQRNDIMGLHEDRFDAEDFTIRALFVNDAIAAATIRSITSNYDGMGGTAYGPRDGGVPDHLRDAADRFRRVCTPLDPVAQEIILRLLLNEHVGQPMSLIELGQKFSGYADKTSARAYLLGMLKKTLKQLAHLYRNDRSKPLSRVPQHLLKGPRLK